MPLMTEYEFTLPNGYIDLEGVLHRKGGGHLLRQGPPQGGQGRRGKGQQGRGKETDPLRGDPFHSGRLHPPLRERGGQLRVRHPGAPAEGGDRGRSGEEAVPVSGARSPWP